MTYTFKLARRLAVSRDFAMLIALALLAACTGDSTAPDASPINSTDNPVALQVSPRLVTIETSQRVQFRGQTHSQPRTSKRGRASAAVTWEASGGTIGSDGMFSSAAVGTFKVIGRGRGRKDADTSVVIVVPPSPDLVRLAVTPSPVAVDAGATRTFTATGYLSDGSTTAIGVTWSATGGEVDPSGVYLAGAAGGSYRVIAANIAGTLADTAAVSINPPSPPAPTLASVVVSPASASLTLGGYGQFRAYGRDSAGDSVAVAVTFSATGGTVTSSGLYTAGQAGGSYKVIAASSGLADTAVVTLTQALASGGGTGIPFGPSGGYSHYGDSGMDPFTGSMDATSPDGIASQLANARSTKRRVLLAMTGGSHDQYLTNGVFDMAKWKAKVDTYNTVTIKQAVAAAVADGTIIGNSVMDEPHVSGSGDGNTWGPTGTMTKARVDSMCGYVKALFPALPAGVAHRHDVFEPTKSYRVCDFIVDQYSSRIGDVVAFRDAGLALGKRDGHAILFSMNILNGGIQAARDGLWSCPLTTTGGRGTYEPNCRMTAQQVRDWGLILGPTGCGLNMWRYDSDFMSKPENAQAFKDVAARLTSLPGKACRRA
jgi:hypothetical protein